MQTTGSNAGRRRTAMTTGWSRSTVTVLRTVMVALACVTVVAALTAVAVRQQSPPTSRPGAGMGDLPSGMPWAPPVKCPAHAPLHAQPLTPHDKECS
jgi:hypothetical protein